ncbi:MAG: cupin domain-containing protein [Acidimicrobiales bacterium]
MSEPVISLAQTPVHLGLDATVVVLPPFTGDMSWYEAYGAAHDGDGKEGRLVSLHTFDESWDQWEVHPQGHELVLCLTGRLRLHQEHPDGSTAEVTIGPGEAVINEPGVWHTADVVEGPAQALFITAGLGTEGRPR